MIGRLRRMPLREVWPHEARDFTVWLRDNVEVLNEVLQREFSNAEAERSAGPFSVDLVAEDEQGNPVIIENQIEKSDHDHLGKIVTYLTALDAKTAVWIVSDPRPEHVGAITWLNESSSAAFYLLKVEAVKIGDSEPAPLLTLIVGPSEESREAGATKKELAERHLIRQRFWESLLNRAKHKTKLHSRISPTKENWIWTGAGKSGFGYSYVIRRHDAQVNLSIDRGEGAENKKIFDQLLAHKDSIEEEFGEPLVWDHVETRRTCYVRHDITLGGYKHEEERWPEIHKAMIDAMIRLEKALRLHISELQD